MSPRSGARRVQHGVGLIEILVSIVIAMLLVLVIYQIYEISEGQKRTITAGSDAQQNAGYALYAIGRDLAMAGNGTASTADALKDCPVTLALPPSRTSPDPLESLRPMPAVIKTGGAPEQPDEITVTYGGSSSLSSAVPFKFSANIAQPYIVPGPVGFSEGDVIAAVQPGVTCTLSTINPGGVAVDPATGFATLTHSPFAGDIGAYNQTAMLVNLGKPSAMGRVVYTVDVATSALRTQDQFTKTPPLTPTAPLVPVVSDVINLKALYALDTDPPTGVISWHDATGEWSPASLAALAPVPWLRKMRQVRAVRVAIVTRSAQYEKDAVTPGPLTMFDGAETVSMTLSADQQHYRYKVLETIVPLRNAAWNSP